MEWWLFAFVKIVIINLILSGDNAIVIAMASRNLPKNLRRTAVFWGTFVAVALRGFLTIIALQLLKIPYLTAVGALLLLWIAIKLINDTGGHQEIHAGNTLYTVVMTIVVADFVMSLDNVIAIASVADGNLSLIILGILLSIPLIVWGSQLILTFIEKVPSIVYIGSGILGFTAGEMLIKDQRVYKLLDPVLPSFTWIVPIFLACMVIFMGLMVKKKTVRSY